MRALRACRARQAQAARFDAVAPSERRPLGLPPEAIAEALDELPGWQVEQRRLRRTVRLTVATHDAGGAVTERDIALARRAEQLLAARTTA
jgi:pterin-4a-carbinolamine dehydratase